MKKLLILLPLLLALCATATAATTTAQLYTRLQSAYNGLSSFQANVKQSNYYPQLKRTISYDGMLYFTPGRMLMHFTSPSVQRLQIEGGKVDLYDSQSNTVFRSTIRTEFSMLNPLEILQLYWNKSTVTITKEEGRLVSVTLKPKQDELVTSLAATINSSSGIVQTLSYTDKTGNTVTYSFSNIKPNAGIAATVWVYTYPQDVQIVEQ